MITYKSTESDCGNLLSHLNPTRFHQNIFNYDGNEDIFVKNNRKYVTDLDMHKLKNPDEKVMSLTSTNLLEGLFLLYFNQLPKGFRDHPELGSHFVTLDDLYICDGLSYLVIEKLKGLSFTHTVKQLTDLDKQQILFQVVYILRELQRSIRFNHNDLIGQNIMLIPNSYNTDWKYNINGKQFVLHNPKYFVKLIDFEMSRADINGVVMCNENIRQRFYRQGDSVPFNTSADLCKIFKNPNMASHLFDNSDYKRMFSKPGCNDSGPPYFSVIPPFSSLCPDDVFASTIFNEFLE